MSERNLEIKIEKSVENELDYENKKYYIDMTAAFALKLITYNQWNANDSGYHEISSRQLNELEQIYEIVYEYFDIVRKNPDFSNSHMCDSLYNDHDKKKSNINDLKELRDELVQKDIYNESVDYKDTNDIEGFAPKK